MVAIFYVGKVAIMGFMWWAEKLQKKINKAQDDLGGAAVVARPLAAAGAPQPGSGSHGGGPGRRNH